MCLVGLTLDYQHFNRADIGIYVFGICNLLVLIVWYQFFCRINLLKDPNCLFPKMNQLNQGESSAGPSVLPAKRKRGRPRKDPSSKHAKAAHTPPGFVGTKEYLSQRADQTNGVDIMVGQPVTGVVEATFDAGYLLTVRIGNSDTNLRGVVFKPGHVIPVTAANDVAPHMKMIRRNEVRMPTEKRGWSRREKLPIQPGAIVPLKHKYSSPKIAPRVPPVDVKGTVVPILLQPGDFSNEISPSDQIPLNTPQSGHMLEFGDNDVHMVEPLAMLPPDRSIPVSQMFMATPSHHSHQFSIVSEQINTSSVKEGAPSVNDSGLEKGDQPMKSIDTDTSGSWQTSDTQTENSKETLNCLSEDLDGISKQDLGNIIDPFSSESLQTVTGAKPFFDYETGKMTELLKAVQENMKENEVHIAEEPTFVPEIEFPETYAAEMDLENETIIP
ncbi:uncharacterized protein [Primulina huaijiensis]|uniref:uncharacterized protein isoform X3 n=1 Tax=Primulina huaijiensis TaxID=1492673 RepID=UPI003CC6E188